jgi:GMP synthase-like glutamine amidotransferase
MRVHVIQHVPFEGPALIADWAEQHRHELTAQLALTEEFPGPAEVGLLVILGGPMDADDEITSPWLTAEKAFVRAAIEEGLPILGVCLGAQILAEVLGGRVLRASEPEIGWYPVGLTPHGCDEPLFALWPASFIVGHWHFDTFELPEGTRPALASSLTPNQAFVHGDRVVGLQFHLEWTPEALAKLAAATPSPATGGAHVMDAETMLAEAPLHAPVASALLFELLDSLAALAPGGD